MENSVKSDVLREKVSQSEKSNYFSMVEPTLIFTAKVV